MRLHRWQLQVLGVAVWFASALPALATCGGDCNSDGQVSFAELVLGVDIGLGNAASAECTAADRDGHDGVTIDELVANTNNAVDGCATVGTPTPTPTVRPTPTVPAGCGDDHVDFAGGETCDDGNTVDGDTCPANCRIATCTADGGQFSVDVTFSTPSGTEVAGVTVLLRYPDGVVRIPGMANDAQVRSRVTNVPDNAFTTRNDLDYALRVVLVSTDEVAFPAGRLFTVTFDTCAGATQPTLGDFSCRVEQAADPNQNTVNGVTCAVTQP